VQIDRDGDVFLERYRLIGPVYIHGFMDGEAIEILDRGLTQEFEFEESEDFDSRSRVY
jgi:hypothetical protein